jgi:poly(A) polymerase
MEAAHLQVTVADRSEERAALTGLELALEAARSGTIPAATPRLVPPEAFRALDMAEVRPLLDALLLCRHADVGLEVLLEVGAIAALFPELSRIVGFGDGESHKDVWLHTKQVVIQCLPRLAVRWGALLHDIGKPRTRSVTPDGAVHFFHHAEEGARMFERIERRLGLFAKDPALAEEIRFLILHHQRAHQYEEQWTDSAVRRFARDIGGSLGDLMALSRADMTTKRRDKRRRFLFQLKDLQERIANLAEDDAKEPLLPKGLGDELMSAFGLPPSRRIGELRDALELAVEAGEVPAGQSAAVYIEFVRSQPARFGLA